MSIGREKTLFGRTSFLVARPDESINQIKEYLSLNSTDELETVTLIISLRMKSEHHERLLRLLDAPTSADQHEAIADLIKESGHQQCEVLLQELQSLSGPHFQPERHLIPLPYIHHTICRVEIQGLVDWLSGHEVRNLVSRVSLNHTVTIPELRNESRSVLNLVPRAPARAAIIPSKTTPWCLGYSKISDLHSSGILGQGQVIAVLDSGIDDHHPRLQGKVRDYAQFDSFGHPVATVTPKMRGVMGQRSAAFWSAAIPTDQ